MTKYLLGLWTLILAGCGTGAISDYATRLTVDPSELKFKKGDCLEFKTDSLTYGVGIVFDFSKDEEGIWYGLLLTDYESTNQPTIDSIINGRFLGRKIQSTLNDKGFVVGIDTEFILDSLLAENFSLVGNVPLNDQVKLGSQGATSDMDGLIQKLKNGKERRLSPPDDYREQLKLDNFRSDEYFDVKDFVGNE